MKVALAPSYQAWMLALFPTTLGVGTAALWWHSLNWPLRVDADGVTLRRHRRLPWSTINRIGVSRSYLDGYMCEMRIHHHGGSVAQISVQSRDAMTARSNELAIYQGRSPARPALGTSMAALRAKLADLWPVVMIAFALGLTLAWTGLLVRLAWLGIERLI